MFNKNLSGEEKLRRSIKEPSENTLLMWNFSDKRKQACAEMLSVKEAETADEEFPNLKITSEVKIKK